MRARQASAESGRNYRYLAPALGARLTFAGSQPVPAWRGFQSGGRSDPPARLPRHSGRVSLEQLPPAALQFPAHLGLHCRLVHQLKSLRRANHQPVLGWLAVREGQPDPRPCLRLQGDEPGSAGCPLPYDPKGGATLHEQPLRQSTLAQADKPPRSPHALHSRKPKQTPSAVIDSVHRTDRSTREVSWHLDAPWWPASAAE